MIKKKTILQFKRFLIVGLVSVFIDFIFYKFFLFFTLPSISKTISFLLGSISSYFANKLFTFRSKNNSLDKLIRFIIIYFISLIINVSINSFLIANISSESKNIIYISFIIALASSATFNFICMKKYVFSNS